MRSCRAAISVRNRDNQDENDEQRQSKQAPIDALQQSHSYPELKRNHHPVCRATKVGVPELG